jgi:hypothetical protein
MSGGIMALYAMRELTRQSFEPLSGLVEFSRHTVNFWSESVAWLPGVHLSEEIRPLQKAFTETSCCGDSLSFIAI